MFVVEIAVEVWAAQYWEQTETFLFGTSTFLTAVRPHLSLWSVFCTARPEGQLGEQGWVRTPSITSWLLLETEA